MKGERTRKVALTAEEFSALANYHKSMVREIEANVVAGDVKLLDVVSEVQARLARFEKLEADFVELVGDGQRKLEEAGGDS